MPFLIYTFLRIAAIVITYGVLHMVGLRGWLLAVVSVLIGMMISYIAFDKQRRNSAAQLQRWVEKRREARGAPVSRFAQFNAEEDAALDAAETQQEASVQQEVVPDSQPAHPATVSSAEDH